LQHADRQMVHPLRVHCEKDRFQQMLVSAHANDFSHKEHKDHKALLKSIPDFRQRKEPQISQITQIFDLPIPAVVE
jgi:hypothetical protein